MKKWFASLVLGSFILPVSASVDTGYDFDAGLNYNPLNTTLYAFSSDKDLELPAIANRKEKSNNKEEVKKAAPVRKGPPRTSFLTGIEYDEAHFKNGDKTTNLIKIIADGGTQITPNFRMMYVISEADRYRGPDNTHDRKRLNTVIQPRYMTRFGQHNFFVGALFKRHVEGDGHEEHVYMLKPGGALRSGKHTLFGFAEILYKENMNNNTGVNQYSTGIISEPEYTYRMNSKISVGAEGLISIQNNNNKFRNFNIKPFVTYTYDNGFRQQWSWRRGKDSNKNDMGNHYTYWQINNNYRINNNFSIMANIGWRRFKQYGAINNNKRESLFFKGGIVSRF